MSSNRMSDTRGGHLSWRRDEVAVALVLGVVHAVGVTYVNHIVPEPYMDEIFHIRQTRKYCAGDYSWDPMITTPPLLYVLAMPLCGGNERFLNSLLYPLTFLGCCRLRRILAGPGEPVLLPALSVVLLPVLLHSSLLFYTDLLSLCVVVWAFATPQIAPSAVLFFVSLFCRQTNIVWAGLYAAMRLLRVIEPNALVRSTLHGTLRLTPFVLLAGVFVTFVYVNGGIVLGDPAAHKPQLHLAQVLYFVAFACFAASFALLEHLRGALRALGRPHTLLLCALLALIVHNFTVSHPYLLADNRHVPFYLWRWVLSKPMWRLCLVPVYAIGCYLMNESTRHLPIVDRLLFVAATMAVVVPAHLIEPRYFIVPYALWRLAAKSTSRALAVLETALQVTVFASLFYLFLFKPFEWSHEPGPLQRFMW